MMASQISPPVTDEVMRPIQKTSPGAKKFFENAERKLNPSVPLSEHFPIRTAVHQRIVIKAAFDKGREEGEAVKLRTNDCTIVRTNKAKVLQRQKRGYSQRLTERTSDPRWNIFHP